MANEKITDYVSSVTTLANGDLLDVSKDTVGNGSVFESQKMTQTVLRTTLGVNGTSGYLPVYDGTKIVPSTIYQSAGGNFGVFGVTTPTFSWSFDGDSVRTIGIERRSGSTDEGLPVSFVGSGAAIGSTNKDAGDVNFLTGPSTGNGTGRMTWSIPAPNQGSGTTTRAASAKMYLLGAGWLGIGGVPTAALEVFTSSSNHKLRVGTNFKTLLSLSTGIGIDLARVSDGSYTISGGIHMVDNSSYRMIISSANAGVAFVRNPASDTNASCIIGGSSDNSGCYIWSGVGATTHPFDFRRVFADSNSATMYNIAHTGTCSASTDPTALQVSNTITNSFGRSYGIKLATSGSTTDNIALYISAGSIAMGTLTPSTSAIIDVVSTTRGVRFCPMTGDSASAITPVDGLIVFITSTNGTFTSRGYWQYVNTTWTAM